MKNISFIILATLLLSACTGEEFKVIRGAVDEEPAEEVPADEVDDYTYPLLIGGTDAAPGEFPWVVAIQKAQGDPTDPATTWKFRCNAALLSSVYVLTSASCVDGESPLNLRVVAGLYQRSDLAGTQTVGVGSYTMHEQYNDGGPGGVIYYTNDIAIINLGVAIAIGGNIQPATLPADNSNNYAGITGVCAGWGRTSVSDIIADTLQKASIEVIVTAQADSYDVLAGHVWDNQLFLFDNAMNVTCGGDVFNVPDGVTRVAGVPSYIPEVSVPILPTYPSVNTRVSAYLAWIAINTP